jgi:WD40 repeat protein
MSSESYKPEYKNSWALVVGIDQYKDPALPPLMTAVKGARAFADLLRAAFGFPPNQVILLENEHATQAAIRRAFTDPLGREAKVGDDDRVVVYFGGHGVTYDTAEGEIGCVTCYDTETAYWDTTIPMDELTRLANRSHAKHVLFLLDACFSGYATTRSFDAGAGRQADDYLTRAARQVISAGMREQLVSDTLGPEGQSLFTGFLLEGLRGAAPTPGGVLRAFHLAGYLQDMVGQHSRSRQTPQYAPLMGSQGGDFIFEIREVPELADPILSAIESDDPAQRMSAVAQLRTLTLGKDEDRAAQALAKLEALTTDRDEMVRASARGALRALIPTTSIVPVVREKLLALAALSTLQTGNLPAAVGRRAILRVTAGPARGTHFEVDEQGGTIGRGRDNWLAFPDDDRLSRKHAQMEWRGGQLWLLDIGSKNGTYVNRERVSEGYCIKSGDEIKLGLTVFTVMFPDEAVDSVVETTKEISESDLQEMQSAYQAEAAASTRAEPVAPLTARAEAGEPTVSTATGRNPIAPDNVAAIHAVRVLKEHLEGINSVAWSPDGLRLAAGMSDSSVMLWDANGKLLRTMQGHTLDVSDVVWSPDGVRLVSASRDSTLSVWDTSTGGRLRVMKSPTGYLTSVGWSFDGALLAAGSRDGTVTVWDAATSEVRYRLAGHTNVANDVEWSPDGMWLASCAADKTVLIWEGATGEWRHVLQGHDLAVRSLAWAPDGQHIASGSADKSIIVWQIATGQPVYRIEGHVTEVASLAWSPRGDVLASGSDDGILMLWDAGSGAKLRALGGIHSRAVRAVDWAPDGARLASGSHDRRIAIWEVGH